jgi:prepilin-type N-terminal cleavage/methylation domain-containing protein
VLFFLSTQLSPAPQIQHCYFVYLLDMKHISLKRGFTLIELMVVIAIIGLLASTVLASLSDARVLARDTARLTEARELMKALELYRGANGNVYPCSTGTSIDCTAGGGGGNAWLVRPNSGLPYVTMEPNLRAGLKFQPTPDIFGYSLLYNLGVPASPTNYTIIVGLEDPINSLTASTTPGIAVGGISGMNYCRITSGTVDEASTFGTPSTAFKEIGRCPLNSLK